MSFGYRFPLFDLAELHCLKKLKKTLDSHLLEVGFQIWRAAQLIKTNTKV